ncbi:perlucin-like [Pecten maximus]|uniref:perlucin-like n=1 Tax=Pecten maximus TaxID=6579 RepID=UPI00145895FC|nr:perlucin-like [Pecten maximus]
MNRICVGLLFMSIVSVRGDCPNGYVRHDDSCYKFFSSVLATWAESLTYCELFESKLAVIETEREQTFIEGLLSREWHTGASDGVWVDGTDLLIEGEWVWADDGTPINTQGYNKWFPGEPNSLGRRGEDCMDLLHHEKYNWNDNSCERKQNFLCEIETEGSSGMGGGNANNGIIGK